MADLPSRSAPPRGWHARAVTAEAAALLALARLLIACVRFGRWSRRLGEPVRARLPQSDDEIAWAGRYLGKAVDRAAAHLPFETKCLPRAMATHWMLARRRADSLLVFAVRKGSERGGLDDLHAWVEAGGAMAIGAVDGEYTPMARYRYRKNRLK